MLCWLPGRFSRAGFTSARLGSSASSTKSTTAVGPVVTTLSTEDERRLAPCGRLDGVLPPLPFALPLAGALRALGAPAGADAPSEIDPSVGSPFPPAFFPAALPLGEDLPGPRFDACGLEEERPVPLRTVDGGPLLPPAGRPPLPPPRDGAEAGAMPCVLRLGFASASGVAHRPPDADFRRENFICRRFHTCMHSFGEGTTAKRMSAGQGVVFCLVGWRARFASVSLPSGRQSGGLALLPFRDKRLLPAPSYIE